MRLSGDITLSLRSKKIWQRTGLRLALVSSQRRNWASLHHSREAFRVSCPLQTPQMQTVQWWLLGCITGGMVQSRQVRLWLCPVLLTSLPSAPPLCIRWLLECCEAVPHPETVSLLIFPSGSSFFCSPFRCHWRPETGRASSLLHNSTYHRGETACHSDPLTVVTRPQITAGSSLLECQPQSRSSKWMNKVVPKMSTQLTHRLTRGQAPS